MRLSVLQVGTWYRLELLAHLDAPLGAEGRLHSHLAPFHIRGEWFWANEEAMERVEEFIDATLAVLEEGEADTSA